MEPTQKTLDQLETGWKLYNKKARELRELRTREKCVRRTENYCYLQNPLSPNFPCLDISCNACFLCEECTYCFDCLHCDYGEHLTDCTDCTDCSQLYSCVACTDCHCCINCSNLKYGLLCVDLHLEKSDEESFWVANQRVTHEEWEVITDEFFR